MSLSHHAEVRLSQRSIPPQVINWLLAYGSVRRSRGRDVYAFDHKARRKLQREIGELFYRRVVGLLDCYAVVEDNGVVVTAAWPRKTRRPARLEGLDA